LKHVGANSVTSVTAYVILYSYIQVHKLVQIKSVNRFIVQSPISVSCSSFHFPLILCVLFRPTSPEMFRNSFIMFSISYE